MNEYILGDNEFTEKDYFDNRVEKRLYLSKQFKDTFSNKNKRYVYKIHHSEKQYKFMVTKNEVVLSESGGKTKKYQLKAIIVEDDKRVENLIIQTFLIDFSYIPRQ